VTGCGGVETAQHMFLSCPVFAPLWGLIRSRVGISSADPLLIQDHFVQFSSSTGGSRTRRSILQLLWLYSIWMVWHELVVFNIIYFCLLKKYFISQFQQFHLLK
jgi:hypothetical protein